MKETRTKILMSGVLEWIGPLGPVLLVTCLLTLISTAPAVAQSSALHRAVKAGDLNGLTLVLADGVDVRGGRGHSEVIALLAGKTLAREEELVRALPEMQPGSIFRDCDQCPEMVVVPAGRFLMGDLSGDGESDERPVHEVAISEPLAVGVYEVTREAFERFVEATRYSAGDACYTFESGEWKNRSGRHWRDPGFTQTDRHPVMCVSWDDAQAYIRWLSRETGKSYRLLSEAEWEYVARARTRTKYWWGNEADHAYANYGKDECCEGGAAGNDRWVNTSPVGSFEANAFGLFDTEGNVWEWVEDCWNDSYREAPTDGTAWTSGNCGLRVLRGAAWSSSPWFLRSANRYKYGLRYSYVGFRVARTLTP